MNVAFDLRQKKVLLLLSIASLLLLPILNFTIDKGYAIYLLIFVIILPIIYIFIKIPKTWIYTVVLSFSIFLIYRGDDDKVAFLEIAIAILIYPGLLLYFLNKILLDRKQLFQNLGDLFLILFFVFLPLNAIIAYLNDVDLYRWLREIAIPSLILLYFPIREYIKTDKDITILLFCALVAAISSIIYLVYHYKETILTTANYAYELVFGLGAKIKINHTIFTGAYFVSIILFVTRKNLVLRIILFFTSFASLVALIITVSRTFWIVTIIGTIILFIYYGWEERLKFLFFYLVIIVATLSFIIYTFGDNYKIVTRLIEYRFLTSAQGKKDKSVLGRLAEYPIVLKGIVENPLWGNGFAKKIRFRDPIFVRTTTSHNIHNGFTSLLYRVGIPMSLLYISFFIFYFLRASKLILISKGNYFQPYVLSGFIILIILFISQFTNQQFLFRDFNFGAFISIAMIEFVYRKYKSGEISN